MRRTKGVYETPRQHWVGDGFPVRSIFSYASHGHHTSPFVLLDYAGPAAFQPAPNPRGVGPHPHRGFETVTIVYQGELEHRDSAGHGGRIGPGDVQWMTAGAGIVHEEFHSEAFTRDGGTLEMVQLWVNLPEKDKDAPAGYQPLRYADIPRVELADAAGDMRIIAGAFGDTVGPARTFTPMNVWDLNLCRNGATRLPLPEGHTAGLLVQRGTVQVNGADIAREGQFVLLDRSGGDVRIEANTDARILVLSGEPIDEPVVMQGPFVMTTEAGIRQAMADFRSGRFGTLQGA